ncbi:MAG: type II toxin-antitoxin system VapC family toxin [Gemmatimonadota bacterium]|nr:PIN domain-containing protein [Gemmatimonadota bacterium]
MIVVADTGALYALADRSDAWHQRVRDWWVAAPRRVVIPTSVVPELCRLLQTRLGAQAELAFVRAIRTREFQLVEVEGRDLPRIEATMLQFADFPLSYVDASVVAVAERLKAVEILSTDRRHFPRIAPNLPVAP